MESSRETSVIKDCDIRVAHSLSPLGGEGWVEGLMTLKVPLTRIAEAILHSPRERGDFCQQAPLVPSWP